MSKEEIVEALKMALARGEDLQKVMISFYNSGYTKEDIKDAARIVQNPNSRQQVSSTTQISPQFQPKPVTEVKPSETVEPKFSVETSKTTEGQVTSEQTPEPNVIQKVSSYGEVVGKPPSKAGTIVIFVLIFFLLVLVGALIGIFLFKEEVANFFSAFVS